MEENKLYRVVKGKKTGFFLGKRAMMTDWDLEDLEEYTPPTSLELEELEEKMKDEIKYHQNDRDSYWWFKCWQYIKPFISAILQAKEEEKKKAVITAYRLMDEVREKEISDLQSQLQEKQSVIDHQSKSIYNLAAKLNNEQSVQGSVASKAEKSSDAG